MDVKAGRLAAVDWINRHARRDDGYLGAYFTGSTAGMDPDAALPTGSDIDVAVVTSSGLPQPKIGKVAHRDVLLDITHFPAKVFASAEDVLSHYHLAHGLRTDNFIEDTTGELRALQKRVARHFAERNWVIRRCADAREKSEAGWRGITADAPWHDQVTTWLFATGVMTHVLLVAALRNPTVRLRYVAVRSVLADYGHAEMYDALLDSVGCTSLSADRTAHHHRALATVFDQAAALGRTPFFFSSEITPLARPIAIDSTQQLIERGDHREVVFWIAATFARCHKILATDAPEALRRLAPAFDEFLADLGIESTSDLTARAATSAAFIPTVWETAEAIMSANPDIVGNVRSASR
ncbi:hypothetical protein AB0G15_13820 [Streptosporangium sp. NPDC023825]|uniref:hypothetical protein n=1 Tax=Streptosporangium sp. NPDC023825 TaxID=3154909 RepID=UPI0034132F63